MSDRIVSREDLLAELVRSGDSDSVARAFYSVARHAVSAFLFNPDPDIVETATSETLLAICRYGHTFRGDAKVSTWVRCIARREAARCAQREAGSRAGTESLADEGVRRRVEASCVVVSRPRAVAEAIEHLRERIPNPNWRRIWLLANEPGRHRSHEEVGRLTGYTPNSVAVILSKVRSLLNRVEQPCSFSGVVQISV